MALGHQLVESVVPAACLPALPGCLRQSAPREADEYKMSLTASELAHELAALLLCLPLPSAPFLLLSSAVHAGLSARSLCELSALLAASSSTHLQECCSAAAVCAVPVALQHLTRLPKWAHRRAQAQALTFNDSLQVGGQAKLARLGDCLHSRQFPSWQTVCWLSQAGQKIMSCC